MYNDLNYEDKVQLFRGATLIYNGRLVKILKVTEGGGLVYFDLKDQKQRTTTKANFDKIANPSKRLGMINIQGGVIYAMRMPVRQYSVGFTSTNVRFETLPGGFLDRERDVLATLAPLQCRELWECYFSQYPSIEECISYVKEFGGAKAFDKQFAISDGLSVWYKASFVGEIPEKAKSFKEIKFKSAFSYLPVLMENLNANSVKDIGIKIT
jgi:hypothetical protein